VLIASMLDWAAGRDRSTQALSGLAVVGNGAAVCQDPLAPESANAVKNSFPRPRAALIQSQFKLESGRSTTDPVTVFRERGGLASHETSIPTHVLPSSENDGKVRRPRTLMCLGTHLAGITALETRRRRKGLNLCPSMAFGTNKTKAEPEQSMQTRRKEKQSRDLRGRICLHILITGLA
jgi:hypothetical protein